MSLTGRVIEERYDLQALIGRGGMGEVYRAHDRHLGRHVAVKVMLEQFAGNGDHLRRFQREAVRAASLVHPNIVHVYDFGVDKDLPYISMELVDGVSLREELGRTGALPAPRAIHLTQQVLHALGYAHERGVIHRDVKPGNILIDETGWAKLTDFGIARLLDETAITESGEVWGTYRYLSPERAEGHPATASSDLYAVGCVLFEMLSGDPPYQADTPVAVALKHLSEPVPSLHEAQPEVSPGLDSVVRRALAKEPQRRFVNAAEFSAALEAASGGAGWHPRAVSLPVEEPTVARPREGFAVAPTAVARPDGVRAAAPTAVVRGRGRSAAATAPRQPQRPSFRRRHRAGIFLFVLFFLLAALSMAVAASVLHSPDHTGLAVTPAGGTSSTAASAPATTENSTTTTSTPPSTTLRGQQTITRLPTTRPADAGPGGGSKKNEDGGKDHSGKSQNKGHKGD